MINKITLLLIIFISISTLNAQITFEWETAIDNGDNVSETIDGITATLSGLPDIDIVDCGGCFGSTNNLVVSQGTTDGTSVIFTFSEPINVNSILAIDGNGNDIDYMFTPSGGNNDIVTASLISGSISVTLNWIDVTSITITSTGSLFGFDNLEIDNTLSIDNFTVENINIYPNPVENVLNIDSAKNLKSIKVFDTVGQLVSEGGNKKIDLTKLTAGFYLVRIQFENGFITKKIIKK